MAYATVDDISSEFKSISFGPTTRVTSAEVSAFIDQTTEEMNAYLAAKYALPISDVNALKLLKNICISIVADRVSNILKVKTQNQKVEQDSKSGRGRVWGRMMLSKLQKGEILLVDASGNQLTTGTTDDGFSSFNVDEDVEHTMKKGVDQW